MNDFSLLFSCFVLQTGYTFITMREQTELDALMIDGFHAITFALQSARMASIQPAPGLRRELYQEASQSLDDGLEKLREIAEELDRLSDAN